MATDMLACKLYTAIFSSQETLTEPSSGACSMMIECVELAQVVCCPRGRGTTPNDAVVGSQMIPRYFCIHDGLMSHLTWSPR